MIVVNHPKVVLHHFIFPCQGWKEGSDLENAINGLISSYFVLFTLHQERLQFLQEKLHFLKLTQSLNSIEKQRLHSLASLSSYQASNTYQSLLKAKENKFKKASSKVNPHIISPSKIWPFSHSQLKSESYFLCPPTHFQWLSPHPYSITSPHTSRALLPFLLFKLPYYDLFPQRPIFSSKSLVLLTKQSLV